MMSGVISTTAVSVARARSRQAEAGWCSQDGRQAGRQAGRQGGSENTSEAGGRERQCEEGSNQGKISISNLHPPTWMRMAARALLRRLQRGVDVDDMLAYFPSGRDVPIAMAARLGSFWCARCTGLVGKPRFPCAGQNRRRHLSKMVFRSRRGEGQTRKKLGCEPSHKADADGERSWQRQRRWREDAGARREPHPFRGLPQGQQAGGVRPGDDGHGPPLQPVRSVRAALFYLTHVSAACRTGEVVELGTSAASSAACDLCRRKLRPRRTMAG